MRTRKLDIFFLFFTIMFFFGKTKIEAKLNKFEFIKKLFQDWF